MMNKEQEPELHLTFSGETVIKETFGFEGSSCTEVTSFIEEAMKPKHIKKTLKAEYHRGDKRIKTERNRI